MLKKRTPEQTAIEMVTLDQLVPRDHLLRKIDAVIDFSFIHDLTAPLYCADNGRPSLNVTPEAGVVMAMILNELATNAWRTG